MPGTPVQFRPQYQVKLSKLRVPRNGAMPVVVVHVYGQVTATLPEQAFRKGPTDEIEGFHPDPLRPRVAYNDHIAIAWRYIRIVPEEKVVAVKRLLPIFAVSVIGYP